MRSGGSTLLTMSQLMVTNQNRRIRTLKNRLPIQAQASQLLKVAYSSLKSALHRQSSLKMIPDATEKQFCAQLERRRGLSCTAGGPRKEIIMRRPTKVFFSSALLLGLATAWGCGSSEDAAATANINGDQAGFSGGKKSKFDNTHPQIVIHTSVGDITADLDGAKAPLTVANFLSYVERDHYAHSIFHNVQPGFIILGGGFDARLEPLVEDPPIRNEAHNGLKNVRG